MGEGLCARTDQNCGPMGEVSLIIKILSIKQFKILWVQSSGFKRVDLLSGTWYLRKHGLVGR